MMDYSLRTELLDPNLCFSPDFPESSNSQPDDNLNDRLRTPSSDPSRLHQQSSGVMPHLHCSCMPSALKLLENMEVYDLQGLGGNVVESFLQLNKRNILEINRFLQCYTCTQQSGFIMLVIKVCQEIVTTSTAVIQALSDLPQQNRSPQASPKTSIEAEKQALLSLTSPNDNTEKTYFKIPYINKSDTAAIAQMEWSSTAFERNHVVATTRHSSRTHAYHRETDLGTKSNMHREVNSNLSSLFQYNSL